METTFRDPEKARHCLDVVEKIGGAALRAAVLDGLAESKAPDRSLLGITRFLESHPDAVGEARRFLDSPGYARMLALLCWQSGFLVDLICKRHEFVQWLWEETELRAERKRSVMVQELRTAADALGFDACGDALRRFRSREMLRIAVRDIFVHAPLAALTRELSALADACLECALACVRRELDARFGPPLEDQTGQEALFTVLGMGKLGGNELNFSSDIDLLFIYSDTGETAGGSVGKTSNAEYFQRLGERLIKLLTQYTSEGFTFRIDMRLRPYGSVGPLAVPWEQAVAYYCDFGRAWERQAMIKARPCAGDIGLGEEFLQQVRPFVYPRFFDDATLEDVRATKRLAEEQMERRGRSGREVKLGRGGIRDIEFTVQMLQLLNGGRQPELQLRNTLQAIHQLGAQDHLSALDAEALSSNYVFLRQVEHRLQIEAGQQRHTLPETAEELDDLALRLGYESGEAFMRVYQERMSATRAILERFLTQKGGGTLWIGELLNPRAESAEALIRLEAMGFNRPEQARSELVDLCNGALGAPHPLHVRQSFTEIAPRLLEALSRTYSPDEALLRLGRVLGSIRAPGTLYEMLRHTPPLAEYLVKLVSNSEYLCNVIIRDPALFDIASSPSALERASTRTSLLEELAALEHAYEPGAALYRLRNGEMLRVAMRELVKDITVALVGDELTQLADVILQCVCTHAREKVNARYGNEDAPFCVLSVGKAGGLEMGYGSDLDLIFVFDSTAPMKSGAAAVEYFSALAGAMISTLKEPTRHGVLYNVDSRLRPDGNKGPIAVSSARFAQYYGGEADVWERNALMKARAMAGDPAFMERMQFLARDIAFDQKLDLPALDRIEALRQKLRDSATPLDLKRDEGGTSEMELITRYWQLQHAAEHPGLRRGDTIGALDYLHNHALIPEDQYSMVRGIFLEFRRIINRMRMMHGGSTTSLPEDEEDRRDLAFRLGIQEDLPAYVQERKARIHALYLEMLDAARKRALSAP